MKETEKRLIVFFVALALAFSVFTPGFPTVGVKADETQTTGYVVRTSDDNGDVDTIEAARLWYIYRERIGSQDQYPTWPERLEAVIESLGFSEVGQFDPNRTNDGQYWEKINSFVFDEVTVDLEYNSQNFATRKLVVTSGGSITIGEYNPDAGDGTTVIRVTESASVNGPITLEGIGGKGGILEIGSGAMLTINQQGLISTLDNGYIWVSEGASVIDYDFEPVKITVDGVQVTFNGQQQGNYYLYYRNSDLEGEKWCGVPYTGEYIVNFSAGSAKVNGNIITTDSFLNFTVGKPIEIELIPPEGKTPIVFINGGYYNIGKDYMRSDDFRIADLWWNNPYGVKKVVVTNNKFSYTPKTNDEIEIHIYYDPEEIIYDAMSFVDHSYLDLGRSGDDGKYHFDPENAYDPNAGQSDGNGGIIPGHTEYGLEAAWAEPGNEFMVEVTQNTFNGTVEMTPGIDFYRIGNKVKALYQGFELLGGNSVYVNFTPASGYDLLSVTIDGTTYLPSAAGMTYSNGTYTLKIGETPKTQDTVLLGLYPDRFRNSEYVKIKKINACFGIPSYSGGSDSRSGSGTGTGTDTYTVAPVAPVTPPEQADDKEPEVEKQTTTTDKADDGTQTTTTSTTYTDGSKVTEKVVEKPDGSTTSTTTTTEADGTKITKKVEEKADGSSKATTTTTETDGTKTTETVEKKTDGTVTTTNTVKDADGASTTEKVVEKPDGSVTTTITVKDADGNLLSTSKVVEKTKEDGTKTITATEKNADGSSSTSKTTINTDGSSKINTTTQNADGSTTKEKITGKADGSLTRTATTTDEDGNVLSTEKEKITVSKSGTETSTTTIENADGSTSESVVKTKTDGSVSSTITETDADGNVSVTVGSTKKDGSTTSKSYAVEDGGVVLTAMETTTTTASIPASVKVNGKSVPVTTVGEGAMKDNTSVKKVTLAASITSIGEDAFSGAKNLKTIKLSANITEIAPGAFDGIKSNATFYITAETDEEFKALVELLKKSGVGSKVKFRRA